MKPPSEPTFSFVPWRVADEGPQSRPATPNGSAQAACLGVQTPTACLIVVAKAAAALWPKKVLAEIEEDEAKARHDPVRTPRSVNEAGGGTGTRAKHIRASSLQGEQRRPLKLRHYRRPLGGELAQGRGSPPVAVPLTLRS